MAIIKNNVENVKFLRNQDVNITRDAAIALLNEHKGEAADGTALLARYTVSGTVKTIVGFVYVTGSTHSITIFDTEGTSGDVEALRREINAKLGEGITSANTATAQFAALSGNAQSTSAETSVAGAKKYADAKISELDVAAITAGEGQFIKSVSQADGKVSATTADMPSVSEIGVQGQAIVAVKQDKGTISASAGTINAQYVNIADSGEKFSATTVEGALAELDTKIINTIDDLDYTGVTTGDGVVITNVTENNGVVSAASANVGGLKLTDYTKGSDSGSVVATDSINQAFSKLEKQIDAEKDARAAAINGLDYTDTAVTKQFIAKVDETDGVISVERGKIESSGKTVVLSADGNDVNFEVNIDNNTLTKDKNGVISVTSSALVQYEGDTKTIAISPVQDGVRTVSSIITLSSVTPSSTTVKEEYALKNASGETIGSTIKIYKDSSLVSIELVNEDPTQDPPKTGQFLKYTYIDASGATQSVYVDVSALLVEAEFESGVTANAAGVVHGVVDPTSEKDSNNDSFLTVGANGFKIDGIKDEIDKKLGDIVGDLDATVTDATSGNHVTITIKELDGKLVQSGLTIEENDIASASDLAALSGKTITAITSANGSITASISNEAGNKTADIQTDADKIKMSGFSAGNTTALSGIAESDSVATAFEKTNEVITENERVTAAALTDLDGRLDVVEDEYISGVSVNGVAVTPANKVAPISIIAATSAATGTTAIVVDTDNSGNITLGISSIDCGYYS